jgi:hypothetical protein
MNMDASIDVHPAEFRAGCLAFCIGSPVFCPLTAPLGALIPGEGLHAWYACNRLQKPRSTDPWDTLATSDSPCLVENRFDDRHLRRWATLGLDLDHENYLWPGEKHADTTRQWGELAYWFPALSRGAATTPLREVTNNDLTGLKNADFSSFGVPTGVGPIHPETHTYMLDKPYSEMWSAFQRLRTFYRDGN